MLLCDGRQTILDGKANKIAEEVSKLLLKWIVSIENMKFIRCFALNSIGAEL